MNFIKRCLLSLKRNLSRVLPLFIIVFILGNVVFSASAIKRASNHTKLAFERTFGTRIKIDFVDGYRNKGYLGNTEEFKNVDLIFRKLNNYQDYQFSNITYYSNAFVSNELSFVNQKENELTLYMFGISHSFSIDEKEYDIEIIKGRHFTDDELTSGKRVALISHEFRKDGHEIEVGESIKVESVIYNEIGEDIRLINEYEIVGIYSRTDSIQNNVDYYSSDNNLSIIYVPLKTLEKEISSHNQKRNYYDSIELVPISAYFQLNDVDELDGFMKEYHRLISEYEKLPSDYYLETSDEIYKKIGQPIESISNIFSFILVASVSITIIVLVLLVFILLKSRKYEIGLLVALGEKKYRILIQYILEIYLVGILALGLSTFTGCKIGELFSENIINEDKIEENYFEEFEVKFSSDYIISVIEVGSMIMIVSVVFPIVYILRLNPKKILM